MSQSHQRLDPATELLTAAGTTKCFNTYLMFRRSLDRGGASLRRRESGEVENRITSCLSLRTLVLLHPLAAPIEMPKW